MKSSTAVLQSARRLMVLAPLALALAVPTAAHAFQGGDSESNSGNAGANSSAGAVRALTFTDPAGDQVGGFGPGRDIVGGTASYDPTAGTLSATVNLAAGLSTEPGAARTIVSFGTAAGTICDVHSSAALALTSRNMQGVPGTMDPRAVNAFVGTQTGTDSSITVTVSNGALVGRPWTCIQARLEMYDPDTNYGSLVFDSTSGTDYFPGFAPGAHSTCSGQTGTGQPGCATPGIGAAPASSMSLDGKRVTFLQVLQRTLALCPASVTVTVTEGGKLIKRVTLSTKTIVSGCQVSGVLVLGHSAKQVVVKITGSGLATVSHTLKLVSTTKKTNSSAKSKGKSRGHQPAKHHSSKSKSKSKSHK